MRTRCENPNFEHFDRYGGRGIVICERWRNSFPAFLADVGPRPSRQHTIEREDNDGNYEPGNCRWATKTDQVRNRSNNVKITANGVTRLLVEWAKISGIQEATIRVRLRLGWSPEQAVTVATLPPPLRLTGPKRGVPKRRLA